VFFSMSQGSGRQLTSFSQFRLCNFFNVFGTELSGQYLNASDARNLFDHLHEA
jgi:hypothetical protein